MSGVFDDDAIDWTTEVRRAEARVPISRNGDSTWTIRHINPNGDIDGSLELTTFEVRHLVRRLTETYTASDRKVLQWIRDSGGDAA